MLVALLIGWFLFALKENIQLVFNIKGVALNNLLLPPPYAHVN